MIGDKFLDAHQLSQLQAAIVLPEELCIAVQTNPHLAGPLQHCISKAVEVSFMHSQTAMRIITVDEIKRRSEICMQIIVQANAEQGFSLLQLIDAVPTMLVDVLLARRDGNVLLEEEHQRGRWTTGDGDAEAAALSEAHSILDGRTLLGDPADPEKTLQDGADLTDGVEPEPFTDEEFERGDV